MCPFRESALGTGFENIEIEAAVNTRRVGAKGFSGAKRQNPAEGRYEFPSSRRCRGFGTFRIRLREKG